ncbi:GNAT family N-acetyltransferase [Phocaeicola sp.]
MIEIVHPDTKKLDCISPNFIYNRIDLFSDDFILLHRVHSDPDFYIEAQLLGDHALLGAWMMDMKKEELEEISTLIFSEYPPIKYIKFYNTKLDIPTSLNNHFEVNLPKTYEELEERLTPKSKRNMARKQRLLCKELGNPSFTEYQNPDIPDELIEKYFDFKRRTHHISYYLSAKEYIKRYHVTNAYTLAYGQQTVAIVLTCEQCPIAYLENLTYNIEFAAYSPGDISYDFMLRSLVQKGISSIFLGGGNYRYKKRYDSIETTVSDGVIYRSKLIKLRYKCIDFYNRHLLWKIKSLKDCLKK